MIFCTVKAVGAALANHKQGVLTVLCEGYGVIKYHFHRIPFIIPRDVEFPQCYPSHPSQVVFSSCVSLLSFFPNQIQFLPQNSLPCTVLKIIPI